MNWDGKHLLAECLPSVLDAVRYAGGQHEILVVDNGSKDGSVGFVQENFPQVRILPLDKNYGFAGGNNRGVAKVQTDIVVFLNNDMIVDPGFLTPLLAGFLDSSVFAVTSQIVFADASRHRAETGKTRARFERGFFYFWHGEIDSDEEARIVPVFWAGGGSCAIDRTSIPQSADSTCSIILSCRGYGPSYQAWKRGWKCLLAPASRVVHKHRSTSKTKFGIAVDNTTRKNQYLFIWKNVTDLSSISSTSNLPRIHGRAMLHDVEPGFEIRAFFRALRQLPEALKKRVANRPRYVLSDREAIARSEKL